MWIFSIKFCNLLLHSSRNDVQKKYEKLIDEAADEISSFVKKARQDNKSQ